MARSTASDPADDDPHVERLASCYREHPAWRRAAKVLSRDATSAVYFSHLPGRVWQLVQHETGAELRPGRPDDPDLVFRFSPGSVDRLASVRGGLANFAIALFECMEADAPEQRVDFRIVAPFARLARRGYVELILAAGPRIAAHGLRRGIRTLAQLRRLVEGARSDRAAPWEVPSRERA